MYISLSVREDLRDKGRITFPEKSGSSAVVPSSREQMPEHMLGKYHRTGLFAKLARRIAR